MLGVFSTFADRLVDMLAPRMQGLAACSGCYTTCHSSGCDPGYFGTSRFQWRCCWKPNCTDSCSYMGGFPYCCY